MASLSITSQPAAHTYQNIKAITLIIMNTTHGHDTQTPAQQLNAFMETMLPEIMRRENGNTSTIHLYRFGGYRVAFNMSAYLLTETGMPCDTTAMQLPALPSPLIMAYTTDTAAEILAGSISEDSSRHEAIATQPASMQCYEEWYREETEIFEE